MLIVELARCRNVKYFRCLRDNDSGTASSVIGKMPISGGAMGSDFFSNPTRLEVDLSF
jgi:hypothetical protein